MEGLVLLIVLILLGLIIGLPIYVFCLGSAVKELKKKVESLSLKVSELESRSTVPARQHIAPAVKTEPVSKPAVKTTTKTSPVTTGIAPASRDTDSTEKAELIPQSVAATDIYTTPDTAFKEPLSSAVTPAAKESPKHEKHSAYHSKQGPAQKKREPQKNWLDSLVFSARTKEEWEAMVGGKLLNRIGALALIIGIGFFLKYSFDNNWISETARVLIGFLAGAIILYSGSRFHKKGYPIFAQGLIGAGVSVLYLSAYASFNYYHLVPQTAAFVLMSAVTIIAFFMAFRYDSLAISLLGWAGGSLTPFLLSAGQTNEIGLFIYLSLLEAGFLFVLSKKTSWTILEPLTFVTTYLTYFLWFYKSYSQADIIPTIIFLTIFWLLFHIYYIINILHSKAALMSQTIAGLNALVYYAAMYMVINPEHHQWMGLAALAICFAYFVPLILFKKRLAGNAEIYAQYVLTSILFLVIATANQFDGFLIPIVWSVEAAFLAWYGSRSRITYVWIPAVGLLALTSVWLAAAKGAFYLPVDQFTLIFNLRSLAFIVLAASLGLTSSFCKNTGYKYKDRIAAALHYGWCIVLLILFTVEVNDQFRCLLLNVNGLEAQSLKFREFLTLPVVWIVYSLILTTSGIKRKVLPVLLCGVGVLALSAAVGIYSGLSFVPIDYFTLVLNYRFAAFLIVIAGLYISSRVFAGSGEKYKWLEKAAAAVQVVLALMIFELVTVETIDHFSKLIKEAGSLSLTINKSHEFCRWLALSVVWMSYCLPVSLWALRKKNLPVLYCGAGAFVLSVMTAAIKGIVFTPIDYFSVMFNYRAAAMLFVIGGTLVIAKTLTNNLPSYNWREIVLTAAQVCAIALGFLLISGETYDYFRKEIYLLSRSTADFHSNYSNLKNLQQMAMSLAWLVYSIFLMVLGFSRRIRNIRIISIILFGLTIIKIFSYDLSFLEPLYRIFSFIALGLILLAASFLYSRYKSIILDYDSKKGASEAPLA